MRKLSNLLGKNKVLWTTIGIYAIILILFEKSLTPRFFGIVAGGFLGYIILFWFINYKKELKIENIFLLLVIPLGGLMLVLIPLGNVPDEKAHLARAYEISEGHLISLITEDKKAGRLLPAEIYNLDKFDYSYVEVKNNIFNKSEERKFVEFPTSALYSFVSYIPQVIGILAGKVINAPVYVAAYMGRMVNFIVFTLLIYFSIKISPVAKKVILLLSLMPIMLQEAISLSPDAFTYGASVLLFALVFNKIQSRDKLEIKDYVLISILCVVIALCKIVYLPLCLLITLIPKESYGGVKKKWLFIVPLAILVVLFNLIWLYLAKRFLIFAAYDVNLQKVFVLRDPFNYITTIFRTIYFNGQEVVEGMFSKFLECFTIKMPYITVYLNMIIFGILCYKEKSSCNYTNRITKLVVGVIILGIFILINTSLYLQWTKTYAEMVEGIQGRYFLPILFLMPVLFMQLSKKVNYPLVESKSSLGLYNYIMLQNILAVVLIVIRHI